MKVRDLINLLEDYATQHGDDAQIAVPSEEPNDCDRFSQYCRHNIYINPGSISTVLTSRGAKVEW